MASTSRTQIAVGAVACGLIALAAGCMWTNRPESSGAALKRAVSQGDLTKTEALLSKGADPDHLVGNADMSVLEYALVFSEKNKQELVALLLKHGANPNTMSGGTPLILKAMQCRELTPRMAVLFAEVGADLNRQGAAGQTVLHAAAAWPHSDRDIVAALLKRGADPNSRDSGGHIPMEGVRRDEDVLVMLIEAGSDITIGRSVGLPPLHYAIVTGRFRAARAMIERGADIREEDKLGSTPLGCASYYGRLDVAKTLVAMGAEVNHPRKSGLTPLHSAAAGFQKETAALLVAHGARLDARDNKGLTPLEYGRDSKASGGDSMARKGATVAYLAAQSND